MGTRTVLDCRINNRKDKAGEPKPAHPGQRRRTEPRDHLLSASLSTGMYTRCCRTGWHAGYSQEYIPGGYPEMAYSTQGCTYGIYHPGAPLFFPVLTRVHLLFPVLPGQAIPHRCTPGQAIPCRCTPGLSSPHPVLTRAVLTSPSVPWVIY